MNLRRLALVLASPCLVADVVASSTGSPICHADDILASPMGFSAQLGYGVVATPAAYTPGQPLVISLLPGVSLSSFNGLLLYVEDPDDLDGDMRPRKAGHFVGPLPDALVFKIDCLGAGGDQVVTHGNATTRSMPRTFVWDAPASDHGPLRLRAIVLKAVGNYMDAPYELFNIDLPVDPVFTDSFE